MGEDDTHTQPVRDPHGLCGTTIAGKYHVERVVGAGGFGVVYRGSHEAFGEPIAIKCLHVADALEPEERDALLTRLQEEGAVLHRLSKRSSTIVQALDAGALETSTGRWLPYLVLEWLEGQTVAARLADRRALGEGPLSLDEAVALLGPVARALALAHRQRIVHRDVKPENIMLVRADGALVPKLLDFGIAKVLTEQARFTASPAATAQTAAALTPQYGAPEQFDKRRGATGPWTDVFALALVLVELLTGRRALDGDDAVQLYVSSANPDGRPTPRRLGVAVDDAVEQVLARALAVEPADRFQDAGEFWDALEQALGTAAIASSSADPRCDTGRFVADQGLAITTEPPKAATEPLPATRPSAPEQLPEAIADTVAVSGPTGAELAAAAPFSPSLYQRASAVVLQWLAIDLSRAPTLPAAKIKSVPVGVALGALFPGIGLLYAAPLGSTLIVLVLGAIAISVAGGLPLVGFVLDFVAPAMAAAISGLLGGAYVWHYNRTGRRTALRTVRAARSD